jgi:SAM-dependent methyltransferase
VTGGSDASAAQSGPVEQCRCCGGSRLEVVLDLGCTPLANSLPADLSTPEATYPLAVAICRDCALVQTTYWVSGELIFGGDYPYYSSYSTDYLRHAREHALELIEARALGPESLVVEIASNDGYLLRNFVERGVPVLGIDPARGPAETARGIGVPTLEEYFGSDLARRLKAEAGSADVMLANNVLAHVDDPNQLAAGVAILLAAEGVAIFEVPYLVDLVERCAFDTVYHEHNCYFSLRALQNLFERHGLHVVDVRRLPVHGGSLRVSVAREGQEQTAVAGLRSLEDRLGVARTDFYRPFAKRVEAVTSGLRELLTRLREQGERVAAYGAAAKGATLANASGIGPDLVAYVVDRNPAKQGRFLPGVRIPIVPPRRLEEDPPGVLLVFVWNLLPEIRTQLGDFPGRFLVPIPEPRLL